MRQALFARTQDLQDLLKRVRARELTPTLLLESQVAARMAGVLLTDRGGDGTVLAGTARELIPLLSGEDESEAALAPLWDALDELRSSGPVELEDSIAAREAALAVNGWRGSLGSRERKRLLQWLKDSFAELGERDPAALTRLAKLLRGKPILLSQPRGEEPREEPRGRRTVLSRTTESPEELPGSSRAEARELLRWRGILTDLLPPDHRPSRRVVVPGGIGCTDLEGPALSWRAIAGTLDPDEKGIFEAHLLSCDLCFEFHYRARWPLAVLRQERGRILGKAEADGGASETPKDSSLWGRILGRLRGS